MKQLELLKKQNSAHGGELFTTRKARTTPRPLAVKSTMHLVLRSKKARHDWSFKNPTNETKIKQIVQKFSDRYGVKVISLANVGNHLHFHIKLSNRYNYKPFIRAITAGIMMAVTRTSRWKKIKELSEEGFWDYRPFTRIVQSYRAFLNLRDYIYLNQLEGFGHSREFARFFIEYGKERLAFNSS